MSSQASQTQPQTAQPQPPRAANAGRVRCPGCGSLIALPATTCSRCQTNLRTGARPEKKFFDESPEMVRKSLTLFAIKQIKRGLLISLLIAAGVLGYMQAKGLDPLNLRPIPPPKPDA
ncbi:MAG: hypothetical protein LBP55_06075, partial [Candidatus Adiutrix sp.]|nr:hypothetical protein [Candidatus Adiutrix sp.]